MTDQLFLKRSARAPSYHLRALYHEGIVTKKRKGRIVRYYPVEDA